MVTVTSLKHGLLRGAQWDWRTLLHLKRFLASLLLDALPEACTAAARTHRPDEVLLETVIQEPIYDGIDAAVAVT